MGQAFLSPATEVGDYLLMKRADDGPYVPTSFPIVIDLSDSANADPINGVEGNNGGGGVPPPGAASAKPAAARKAMGPATSRAVKTAIAKIGIAKSNRRP